MSKHSDNISVFPISLLEDVFGRAGYDYDWESSYIPLDFACREGFSPTKEDLGQGEGQWGVMLCMTSKKCHKAATAIDDLGMMPADVGRVICLDCENLPEYCQPETLAYTLVSLGVVPVYLEDGIRNRDEIPWVVSNEDLVIHDISARTVLIQYYGEGAKIGERQKEQLIHLHRQECAAAHELALRRSVLRMLPKWPANTRIEEAAQAICFGKLPDLDPIPYDFAKYEKAVRIGCRISPNVYTELAEHDLCKPWNKNAKRYEAIVGDAVNIWLGILAKWKVRLGEYEGNEMEQLMELGRALGVESAITAYFSGVPIADIQG